VTETIFRKKRVCYVGRSAARQIYVGAVMSLNKA